MKRWINLLTIVLGVQIILGATLLLTEQDARYAQSEPLFSTDLEQADRWVIEDEDGNRVTLEKTDGTWRLPDLYGLPANSQTLNEALKALSGLKKGWPVAQTQDAHQRFKVTEDTHVRKVEAFRGDEALTTFYLGTSPTFKRIHLRLDGDDAVYAIDFAAYQLPAKVSDWLDPQVAAVNPETLIAIQGADFILEKRDGKWTLSNLPEGKVQDDKGIQALLDDLKTLSVLDALGTENRPEYGLSQPVLTWTLRPASGEPITLTLGKHKEGWYALKRSDQPVIFKVAAYIGDRLAAKGIGPLTRAAPEEKPASPSATPDAAAQTTDTPAS